MQQDAAGIVPVVRLLASVMVAAGAAACVPLAPGRLVIGYEEIQTHTESLSNGDRKNGGAFSGPVRTGAARRHHAGVYLCSCTCQSIKYACDAPGDGKDAYFFCAE